MDARRSLFRTLSIQGFRGFRELTIENLGRTNLFLGANNVGKTALLESLFLLLGSHSPDISIRLNHFRGIDAVSTDPEETWGWQFHDKEISAPIVISARDEQGGQFTLTVELSQSVTAMRPTAAPPQPQPRAVPAQELSTAPGRAVLSSGWNSLPGLHWRALQVLLQMARYDSIPRLAQRFR